MKRTTPKDILIVSSYIIIGLGIWGLTLVALGKI